MVVSTSLEPCYNVGGMLIFGNEEQLLKSSAAWEFGGLINAGIGYRFR
ncbi:MAG: hypothetical protein L3J54_11800 [Draconibacterium sp.]|nr:hypothetical protein [Draconibacterium sp.]